MEVETRQPGQKRKEIYGWPAVRDYFIVSGEHRPRPREVYCGDLHEEPRENVHGIIFQEGPFIVLISDYIDQQVWVLGMRQYRITGATDKGLVREIQWKKTGPVRIGAIAEDFFLKLQEGTLRAVLEHL